MKLKPGVSIMGIRNELILGLMVAKSVFDDAGHEFIITSVTDGDHSFASLHYAGAAADIRIKHITAQQAEDIVDALEIALPNDFDVVLEPDHIHLEWQPKRRG